MTCGERVDRGDGHAADRVDRARRGRAARGVPLGRPPLGAPSRRGSTARSPPRCGRRCRGRPGCAPGCAGRRGRRARPARPRRGSGWPPARRRARPGAAPPSAPAPRRARARRRRGRRRRPAAAPAPPATSSTSKPSGRSEVGQRLGDGLSPTTSSRGAGTRGSRKISTAPPDRHGLATVTAPSSAGPATSPGTMRSSSGWLVDSVISPYSRTDASAQVPPTNPAMEPSARTSAVSPACALVGFCARTTVAWT